MRGERGYGQWDLMLTVRHLVYHWVEESCWYQELVKYAILHMRMALCLCLSASENQAL